MKKEEIIKLGVKLGLEFNANNNFKDALKEGRVVFDGCNGQRFLFESSWTDDEILSKMGESLILLGKRQKCLEIYRTLSINSD